MKISALAVFCGSKTGKNPIFATHAALLGAVLAKQSITVIYGGGNKGMMGTIANAALENGGKVIGIIPKFLCNLEHMHEGLSELEIVETMHIRKQMLYEKCDAAIILPGGFGTLDEVFEMLTWNQLELHNKHIFFLNSAGFYDHLLAHFDKMQEEGFLYGLPMITVINEPEELVGLL